MFAPLAVPVIARFFLLRPAPAPLYAPLISERSFHPTIPISPPRKLPHSPPPPYQSPSAPPESLPASAPSIAARPIRSANSFPSAHQSPAVWCSPQSPPPDAPPLPPPRSTLSIHASARWSRIRALGPASGARTSRSSQTRCRIYPASFPFRSSSANPNPIPSEFPPALAFHFATSPCSP